ncbi:hypothetical protein V2W45_134088 [Cenococcum geophilum]
MDCRTLGGFQACLCGTSGCSAKLSLPRAGGWQRNIKAKLVSRVKPLAAAALAYFLPKRENFNAHHEMIERVAIIPLGLCAMRYYLPTPRDPVALPCRDPAPFKPRASALSTHYCRSNHRGHRVRADRGKALALNVLIHPCFESPAPRRFFEARRRRFLACHSHTKSSPRGGPLIQPHPEFSVLTWPNSRRHTPGINSLNILLPRPPL